MSHVTSDLEYFMCDMCQTYVHKEIFCPHRRECKGKDSKELKKAEIVCIASSIDDESRGKNFVAAGGPSSTFQSAYRHGDLDKAQRLHALKGLRELEGSSRLSAKERLAQLAKDAAESKALTDFLDE